MTVTAQETVTLPEGAIVTIAKCEEQPAKKGAPMRRYTLLSACRNGNAIEMKVDNISSQNVRQYLEMVVREINRRREAMLVKPEFGCHVHPKSLKDFVEAMVFSDMFVFEALAPQQMDKLEDVPQSDQIPPAKKPRRRKAAKKAAKPTNGDQPF